MAHQWQRVQLEDNHGNMYNGYLCEHCEYIVVAYPPLGQESYHDSDYRLILVRLKDLTPKDADKWCAHYKVECESNGKHCSELATAARFTRTIKLAGTAMKVQDRFGSALSGLDRKN